VRGGAPRLLFRVLLPRVPGLLLVEGVVELLEVAVAKAVASSDLRGVLILLLLLLVLLLLGGLVGLEDIIEAQSSWQIFSSLPLWRTEFPRSFGNCGASFPEGFPSCASVICRVVISRGRH